jgi:hypothetical protein
MQLLTLTERAHKERSRPVIETKWFGELIKRHAALAKKGNAQTE